MNRIKVNCYLFLNSANKNEDQTELKTLSLDSCCFNYADLLKNIRKEFKESLKYERIITYWENSEHELVRFFNDESMMNAIKSQSLNPVDLTPSFNVYIEKLPLETYLPDNFFI